MKFNEEVVLKLNNFISQNKLSITEQYMYWVHLQSKWFYFRINLDPRGSYKNLMVSSNQNLKNSIDIDDRMLDLFFGSDLVFNELSTKFFLINLLEFFEGPGKGLLVGDMELFGRMEEYLKHRSKIYNENLRNIKPAPPDILEEVKNGNYGRYYEYFESQKDHEYLLIMKQKYENNLRKLNSYK